MPAMTVSPFHPMPARPRAVAFDVDAISLASLREALPEWDIEIVNGATASSITRLWNPAEVDLLIVGVRGKGTDTLDLCRFLAFCTSHSDNSRQEPVESLGRGDSEPGAAVRTDAPLFVLVSPGEETFIEAALEAGAHGCFVRPIHFKEVISMLARTRAGNQPGRHTLDLERAQHENPWRDHGGEG